MTETAITRAEIATTEALIRPFIRRTPTIEFAAADFGLSGFRLTCKLEFLQRGGSFKVRGAFAHMLLRDIPSAGVVAASGGNHGVAVAFAAMSRGVPAAIFVPSVASPAKLAQIRSYRAALHIHGDRYDDALAASQAHVKETGALAVHAFDQRETLLGQGSVGLELEQQAADLDTLLVAIGGGGVIGGIAAWYDGKIRVVGVEPETAPTMARALAAGRPVDAEAGGIAAESLAPKRVGELSFPIVRRAVEQVVLVTDEAIRQAQTALWETARVVVEPGGATAFAALLSGRYQPRAGEHVGVLLCGANTTAVDFDR